MIRKIITIATIHFLLLSIATPLFADVPHQCNDRCMAKKENNHCQMAKKSACCSEKPAKKISKKCQCSEMDQKQHSDKPKDEATAVPSQTRIDVKYFSITIFPLDDSSSLAVNFHKEDIIPQKYHLNKVYKLTQSFLI